MRDHIEKLASLAKQDSRLIIGLMSGTSLDGLDIALCTLTGTGLNTDLELLKFATSPFSDAFKNDIRQVFAKQQVDLLKLSLLNVTIAQHHAALILEQLAKWHIDPSQVDLIASHGQTVFHAPQSLHKQVDQPNATLQIGDGDHIAAKTGIITISDFRQKHIAHGGEGAPLAAYGDYLLCSSQNESRILLNIGGISNCTYLPQDGRFGSSFCTDIGPGNTLMDAYVQANLNREFDNNGEMARAGKCNSTLLNLMLDDDFFKLSLPKTTGQEYFNIDWLHIYLNRTSEHIKPIDVLSTLNHFSALCISQAIQTILKKTEASYTKSFPSIYVSGGGHLNQYLLENIAHYLKIDTLYKTEDIGLQPDAKEAILFAVLANETIAGNSETWTQKASYSDTPAVTMGKICLP